MVIFEGTIIDDSRSPILKVVTNSRDRGEIKLIIRKFY